MKDYIREIRPKNWLKNVFVFIPITFALELTQWDKLLKVIVSFAACCLVSSAVYVLNDIADAQRDACHPVKCTRPIAAGRISKPSAAVFSAVLMLFGLLLAANVASMVLVYVIVYALINVAYSFSLKHMPIVDCFCIAAGFVLRVFIGGVSVTDGVSDWLFMTIMAMSLFMAFGKRRGEILKSGGNQTRRVLEHYDLVFLNGMTFVCAGLAIVFYSLWAMTRGHHMIYTVPLIIFIVCKYLQLIYADSHGDPTTVILGSKCLLAACGIYAGLTVALLYIGM